MSKPLAVDTQHLSIGALLGKHGGGSVIGNFERKLSFRFYQGMCKRRLWKWASVSIGEPGVGGVLLLGTLRER